MVILTNRVALLATEKFRRSDCSVSTSTKGAGGTKHVILWNKIDGIT